jgi:dsDNA-specific endonuclease/ATPase MutS2
VVGSVCEHLSKTLMAYRLRPQSTGISPAELLLGRRLRSRLTYTAEKVESQQRKQKEQRDAQARHRHLEVGDDIFVNRGRNG